MPNYNANPLFHEIQYNYMHDVCLNLLGF